ncbi:MAG: homocysteine S-methyltransferase family protein, partial [Nitrospinae bacterium]|nr:homocysteine S-methyltransferase family protein [Nitrospinota bacterium]
MEFRKRLKKGIVIFDGAMGTQIHLLKPSDKDYLNKTGCSEILNLTIPDKIQRIHESYLSAGADVVETNTFGANEIVLSEYNIADKVEEINIRAAEIAKGAARKFSDTKPRFAAGSMGPGTKLASLGHTTYDRLYESYFRQAKALIRGGVDLFIIETCQDPLQIKACINAVRDANNLSDTDLPIIVSVTIETTGTLLIGTELIAISAIVSPFNIDALGINCAMGPDTMGPYVRELSKNFNGPIIVMPNAGIPQNIDGEVVYSLSREEFVKWLVSFVKEDGVRIVGGCCGTDPSYIEELSKNLKGVSPGKRAIEIKPAIASIYSSVSLSQDPAPLFLGERTNTNGSKKFREFLLNNDFEGMLSVALEQEKSGAHALDLCVAYTGRNEISDMREAVIRFARRIKIPLVIDTTDTNVMEDALKNYGGRAIINSINLEDGEERAHRICKIAKKFGAALIALTIDEKGMAHEVDRKLEIARRLYDIAVNKNNLSPSDLIFDPLTFTLGSGDESLKNAGINTLNGIKEIKKEFSESFTVLGLSNISFGLKAHSREILNSVFLSEAIKSGLDIAIVNIKNIIPIHSIDMEDMETALNLIYNRGENSLLKFIEYFDKKEGISPAQKEEFESHDIDTRIKNKIISGNPLNLENLLHQKLKEDRAVNIINNILIPAMKVV